MSEIDDPIGIVRDGYDRLDGVYRDWVSRTQRHPRARFVDEILSLTPFGADVLELGCGPGTDAAELAEGHRYTGVDLSGVQLAHARASVPDVTFVHGDLFEVELPPASFDAVVALYAFVHAPAARLGELVERIRGWLRPGGWVCASFGSSDNPGEVEPTWLGTADMYFSSLPPALTERLFLDASYAIRSAETITELEPGNEPATFFWVLAQWTGEETG